MKKAILLTLTLILACAALFRASLLDGRRNTGQGEPLQVFPAVNNTPTDIVALLERDV